MHCKREEEGEGGERRGRRKEREEKEEGGERRGRRKKREEERKEGEREEEEEGGERRGRRRRAEGGREGRSMNIGMTIECTCIHMLWTGHVQKLLTFIFDPVGQTSSTSISSLEHSQEIIVQAVIMKAVVKNFYTPFVSWNNGDNGRVQGQAQIHFWKLFQIKKEARNLKVS